MPTKAGVRARMANALSVLHRRSRIVQIEHRIARLDEQATRLLDRERETSERVMALQEALGKTVSRIRIRRIERALRRREERLTGLRERRQQLVQEQIRTIMFALQEEAQRTRDELDRQLDRLVPVHERWERLRGTFDALESTIGRPAFASLAGQWQGQLEIPEFPVAQQSGYAKPFPQQALLF